MFFEKDDDKASAPVQNVSMAETDLNQFPGLSFQLVVSAATLKGDNKFSAPQIPFLSKGMNEHFKVHNKKVDAVERANKKIVRLCCEQTS